MILICTVRILNGYLHSTTKGWIAPDVNLNWRADLHRVSLAIFFGSFAPILFSVKNVIKTKCYLCITPCIINFVLSKILNGFIFIFTIPENLTKGICLACLILYIREFHLITLTFWPICTIFFHFLIFIYIHSFTKILFS